MFHVSSHDLRCGSGDSCFQKIFCMSGVSVWTLNAFYLNAAELPSHNCALFVLRLCIQICACACAFAWVLHARTSNKAWSHASYSIQQLFFFFFLCKMLIWKSKCCVYVRVNKRLRATVCSCGYRDMAEFGIWLLLRLQMEILFNVCVPESPSLFAAVYRTLHFLLWSWYRARAAMGNKITCIDVKCFFFLFFFKVLEAWIKHTCMCLQTCK